MLDCIAGLQTPDSGRIALAEGVYFNFAEKVDLPPQHRHVAYVFQSLALFPHLTVEENIAYGLFACGAAERRERTDRRDAGISYRTISAAQTARTLRR